MLQNNTEILLSLATGPVILGMLGVKTTIECLQSLGKASEEVFRGASLPVLHFPDSSGSVDDRSGSE